MAVETEAVKFDEEYARYKRQVKVLARVQTVPGLDVDDIEAEMLLCIWKAAQTYRPSEGLPFGAWWWTVWLNRRSDIAEHFFADKRPRPLVCDPAILKVAVDHAEAVAVIPPCPTAGRADEIIWRALASGRSAIQAMREAEVSKRGYYNILRGWQSAMVRRYLTNRATS